MSTFRQPSIGQCVQFDFICVGSEITRFREDLSCLLGLREKDVVLCRQRRWCWTVSTKKGCNSASWHSKKIWKLENIEAKIERCWAMWKNLFFCASFAQGHYFLTTLTEKAPSSKLAFKKVIMQEKFDEKTLKAWKREKTLKAWKNLKRPDSMQHFFFQLAETENHKEVERCGLTRRCDSQKFEHTLTKNLSKPEPKHLSKATQVFALWLNFRLVDDSCCF